MTLKSVKSIDVLVELNLKVLSHKITSSDELVLALELLTAEIRFESQQLKEAQLLAPSLRIDP